MSGRGGDKGGEGRQVQVEVISINEREEGRKELEKQLRMRNLLRKEAREKMGGINRMAIN